MVEVMSAEEHWRKIVVHVERQIACQQQPGQLHDRAAQLVGAIDYEVGRIIDELSQLMPDRLGAQMAPRSGGVTSAAEVVLARRLAA